MNPENTQIETESTINTQIVPLKQVTPLSKYLALALFILLPFLGGYVGYVYAPEKTVEVEKVVSVDYISTDSNNQVLDDDRYGLYTAENVRNDDISLAGLDFYAYEVQNYITWAIFETPAHTFSTSSNTLIGQFNILANFMLGDIYMYFTPDIETRNRTGLGGVYLVDVDDPFDYVSPEVCNEICKEDMWDVNKQTIIELEGYAKPKKIKLQVDNVGVDSAGHIIELRDIKITDVVTPI